MTLFSQEEGLFKIKPTKGVINNSDPNRSDLLNCEQIKSMNIEELAYLKSVLPIGCMANLRVSFELKIKTYSTNEQSIISRQLIASIRA